MLIPTAMLFTSSAGVGEVGAADAMRMLAQTSSRSSLDIVLPDLEKGSGKPPPGGPAALRRGLLHLLLMFNFRRASAQLDGGGTS
eukprot:SAG31_NODE_28458_length_410_cov_0.726688_1_plen_84_part_01